MPCVRRRSRLWRRGESSAIARAGRVRRRRAAAARPGAAGSPADPPPPPPGWTRLIATVGGDRLGRVLRPPSCSRAASRTSRSRAGRTRAVGEPRAPDCSPGCWTLMNSVDSSGVKYGPVPSASIGRLANRNATPAFGPGGRDHERGVVGVERVDAGVDADPSRCRSSPTGSAGSRRPGCPGCRSRGRPTRPARRPRSPSTRSATPSGRSAPRSACAPSRRRRARSSCC